MNRNPDRIIGEIEEYMECLMKGRAHKSRLPAEIKDALQKAYGEIEKLPAGKEFRKTLRNSLLTRIREMDKEIIGEKSLTSQISELLSFLFVSKKGLSLVFASVFAISLFVFFTPTFHDYDSPARESMKTSDSNEERKSDRGLPLNSSDSSDALNGVPSSVSPAISVDKMKDEKGERTKEDNSQDEIIPFPAETGNGDPSFLEADAESVEIMLVPPEGSDTEMDNSVAGPPGVSVSEPPIGEEGIAPTEESFPESGPFEKSVMREEGSASGDADEYVEFEGADPSMAMRSTFSQDSNETGPLGVIEQSLAEGKMPSPEMIHLDELLDIPYSPAANRVPDAPFLVYYEMGVAPWDPGKYLFFLILQGTEERSAQEVNVEVEWDDSVIVSSLPLSPNSGKLSLPLLIEDQRSVLLSEFSVSPSASPLGSLFISYRIPDSEEYGSLRIPLMGSEVMSDIERTSSNFQFAVSVVALGEKLKNSPSLSGYSYEEIQSFIESIPLQYGQREKDRVLNILDLIMRFEENNR